MGQADTLVWFPWTYESVDLVQILALPFLVTLGKFHTLFCLGFLTGRWARGSCLPGGCRE